MAKDYLKPFKITHLFCCIMVIAVDSLSLGCEFTPTLRSILEFYLLPPASEVWGKVIEFSRNYTKLAMLSLLYCFVVKGK